jgi:hypothetical protein
LLAAALLPSDATQRALAILRMSRRAASSVSLASREGRFAGVDSSPGSMLSVDSSDSLVLVVLDSPVPATLRREDRPRTSFCSITAAVSACASMASSVASFAPARAFSRTELWAAGDKSTI